MQVIDGDRLVSIDPVYDEARQKYCFPCGCEFDVDPEGESPNGHPSLILNRELREDCPLTWNMLATGLTTGVFQLESNLGMSYARKLKPESIEHLSALVALLRPGVLKVKDEDGVNTAEHYCYRKNGVEPIHDRFPVIAHFLARSYGLMIFQEQHSQIARLLCDFTPIEADRLRKVVAKKLVDEIREVGKIFVERAALKGLVTREEARIIFNDIQQSGMYCFNASHSVGYALSTFETAYWKAHLPIYFFTSYLDKSSYKQKPRDEIRRLMKEIRKLRIKVLPPRFTDLQPLFHSDNVKVRFGLSNVSGIGAKTIDKAAERLDREVMAEWSWYEFLTMGLEVCKPAMVRAAIKAGGLDDFDFQRLRMLDEVAAWCDLTDRERAAISELGNPIYKTVPIIETREVEVEAPVYDKAKLKLYKESLKSDAPMEHPVAIGVKSKMKKVKVEVGEDQVLVDEARPVEDLESALSNLMERPGILTQARREKVGTILDLLRNPPTPQVDQPYMKVKQEVDLLGVALTASTVDGVDVSLADTTIPEFLEGDGEEECVIACEVLEFYERTVRTGPNAGSKMGSLIVGDGENVLENVVMFSQSWGDYGHVVMRPNAAVAIRGKRHWKDEKTFVVNEVEALA